MVALRDFSLLNKGMHARIAKNTAAIRIAMLQLWKIVLTLLFSVCALSAKALDVASELAKKSQNPVDFMISLPVINNINYDFGPRNNTQVISQLKPVIPFHLTAQWNLISRTIIPLTHQPNLLGKGYTNGLGDLNPSFFISPAKVGKVIWGLGPAFVLPTATNRQLGQGKYSLGPSLVVLTMPKRWVLGMVASNVWSVGGESNRPYVNAFSLQYFINYNFPKGWYLTAAPIITADWTQGSRNRWTVPFGGGFGHIFKLGQQAMGASLQAYDNLIHPKLLGPNWQVQLNFSFLFPLT